MFIMTIEYGPNQHMPWRRQLYTYTVAYICHWRPLKKTYHVGYIFCIQLYWKAYHTIESMISDVKAFGY